MDDAEITKILKERDAWKLIATDKMKLIGWDNMTSVTFSSGRFSGIEIRNRESRDWILDLIAKAASDPDWANIVVQTFREIDPSGA